jgi:L-ascorbate metabolism protein UlaG (beta-lactamase superfamily)
MGLREVLRDFKAAALTTLFILPSALSVCAQKSEASASAPPTRNDNSLIEIQAKGGDSSRPGNITIEFYGHDAFRIKSPAGLPVLADPWRNDPTGSYPKWFLNKFPAVQVDIVLSTHAHFDHDAVDAPDGSMVLERLVGKFELGDVEIIGLADKHQCESMPCPPKNETGFENAIQIVATGGLRIAIWGDNRAVPDPPLDPYLKNVDVLILPVDTVLTRPEVDAIVRKYDPKAIIPSHYFVEGLTTDASGLNRVDSWINDQERTHHADVHRLDHPDLLLNPADLQGSHHRIYYFGDHFEKRER